MGFKAHTKGYHVWDLQANQIHLSRDTLFNESYFPRKVPLSTSAPPPPLIFKDKDDEPTVDSLPAPALVPAVADDVAPNRPPEDDPPEEEEELDEEAEFPHHSGRRGARPN